MDYGNAVHSKAQRNRGGVVVRGRYIRRQDRGRRRHDLHLHLHCHACCIFSGLEKAYHMRKEKLTDCDGCHIEYKELGRKLGSCEKGGLYTP